MKKIFVLYSMLMLIFANTQAQKISSLTQYDTMVHVYKLNYEQTKFIIKENKITDTSFLFTKKYKEYPRTTYNADILPDGNFIVASINDIHITYTYLYNTPILISPKVINDDVIFYVSLKKNKKLIKNVKIEIDGKEINYDSGYGGFSFSKKMISKEKLENGNVILKISYEGEIYVFKYNITEGAKEEKPNNYYNNKVDELNSPGYLILDKPFYKPFDSLNLKAFLINFKNGNPLHKKANLSISEEGQKFNFTKKIKQKTAGAFLFQWQLPDTLKLDRDYQVKLSYRKKGRKFAKYTSFKLQEYELNKNKFDVEMPNENFYSGDDITFYATAKDMNGFPVQGTRIHVNLRLDNLLQLFTDSLTITQNKKSTWYEYDTIVEYENFIELKIPSGIFPKANGQYTLDVTFIDPVTYEKKILSKRFTKYTQKEKLLFYQKEDSVIIRNLYNSKDTAKNYFLISFNGSDTISKKKITTPFYYKLSEFETSVLIINKDSLINTINIAYNKLEMVNVVGKRTGDSVFISFAYPFVEPVHYKIYKKDKLIKSEETNNLKLSFLDKSLDEYKIIFTTNLQNGIENNFYEMKFVPEKNLLHFDKNIPKTALPGDSVLIEITAKDFKNQPKKNINIAAYAINNAFEEKINPPFIDVPEIYKNKIEINPVLSRDVVRLTGEVRRCDFIIKNDHFNRFNLRKNEYYQLKYPENELTELQIKKQQAKPEFAIFITHKNILYTPKYILVDNQPIFISDINGKNIYSFIVDAGNHDIAFRYFDKKYEMKNVTFLSNTKHLFGINIDSNKNINSRFKIKDSLTMLEPTESEKEMLYNTLLLTNVFLSDSSEIISENKNYSKKYFKNYSIPNLNIDGDYYYVFGPLKSRSNQSFKVNERTFNLKTGIDTFYFYDDILHHFISKSLGKIKGAFFNFKENYLQISDILDLQIPDTIAKKPEEVKMKYKPETSKAFKIKEEENFYQNYYSSKQDGNCRFIVENNNDTNYIKSMWIITKTDFKACDFIQYVSKNVFQFNRMSIKEPFDVYLFFNKNKMVILKNQHHENNNEFYINASYFNTEDFEKEKIEIPLKIYSELNSVPLLPFYDMPFETKEKIKKVNTTNRNNIYLHGMITDENQRPLNGALVYAEINGKYKFGAVTNQNGLFEMLDLIPATYQLKIYHPQFKISHFEPILLESKNEYLLNTSLVKKELFAPLYETINNDFRMMAYIKKEQVNVLKISVHQKDTRENLENIQVKLIHDNQTIKTYYINNSSFEIPFPAKKDILYSLELSKTGYTSIRLNNIEFVNLYNYVIEAFLGFEKIEILKTKEFNLEMYNQLPYLEYEKKYEVSEGPSNQAPPFPNLRKENEVVIKHYKAPLTSSDGKRSIDKEEIRYAPTITSGDLSVVTSGSYTHNNNASPSGLNLGGDRASGTAYMIDGELIRGTKALNEYDDFRTLRGNNFNNLEGLLKSTPNFADASMIDQVMQNKNTSTVRKKFNDVGYWKPNVITNKNGMTFFKIKLPDNITSWKSYVVGFGKHWLHGIDSTETKVYKPLQTTCIVPTYFYQEDKLLAKIKLVNLTKDNLNIHAKVMINNSEKLSKNVEIKNTYVDSVWIDAEKKDTIAFEGGLTYREHYKDFEHYDIPVFSTAMKYFSNQNLLMEKDSTYFLNIEPNTKGTIIFNNTLYEKVVSSINELNKYEYGCVEQTTSKLNASLIKHRIQKKLEIKENTDKEIWNLLAKLTDMQNKDGSFGWWRKNDANDRMTIYAMEICYKALLEGFTNNVYYTSTEYVKQNLYRFSNSDKVYAYSILSETGSTNNNLKQLFDKIEFEYLGTTDKIYYYQTKLKLNEEVKKEDLYSVFLEINQHIERPYYDNFFYDYRADLFNAYSLFKNTEFGKEFVSMFRKKLIAGQYENNLNIFSKAKMIEALAIDAITDTTKPIQSTLTINDTLKIKTFPTQLKLNGSSYKIKHIGGDVFLNTSEEHFTQTPTIHDSVFAIRTSFNQKNSNVENIISGINCEFIVDVQCFKSGENVMVEIPIPSGMKVILKNLNIGNGNYVEYYKHKIVFFYSKLTMGTKQISIPMLPLFKGIFTLPAAKISLMYYPFVYGNNLKRTIEIK